MNIVNTESLPSVTQIAWTDKMLSIEVPGLIHGMLAMDKKMSTNSGYIYRVSRTNRLENAMVPLEDSPVIPPAINMSRTDIDVKPKFYGKHMILTEQATLLNVDPVMNEAVKVLGIQMRTTMDALTRDALAATASVYNCTGGVNGDNVTEMTRADISKVTTMLKRQNARTITNMVGGAMKIGTGPVRNCYVSLSHSDMSEQLENVQGFLHAANYPSQNSLSESEWGTVGSVRFMMSSEGSKDANASGLGHDIYNNFFAGMEAYFTLRLDKYTAAFIHRPGIYDSPYANFDTVCWKMCTASKVANDRWISKVRCTLA